MKKLRIVRVLTNTGQEPTTVLCNPIFRSMLVPFAPLSNDEIIHQFTTSIKSTHSSSRSSTSQPRSRHTAIPSCGLLENSLIYSGKMAGPSPHKPRNRGKKPAGSSQLRTSTTRSALSSSETVIKTPLFPLASLLWPARGSTSQWNVLPFILMAAGLFRWAAGLWGYSGTFGSENRHTHRDGLC